MRTQSIFLCTVSSALETTILPPLAPVQRVVIVPVVPTLPVRSLLHLERSLFWEQLPQHPAWREQINRYARTQVILLNGCIRIVIIKHHLRRKI